MNDNKLIIATRESPLAMWQAEHVKASLETIYPNLTVELLSMSTEGDRFLQAPLAAAGGKGLFIKELEQCLLDGRADIAVHSMKDVTVDFPDGLHLPVIMQREDPRDAFISNHYDSLDELPEAAVVGTSSLRRKCQLAAYRPDLQIRDLRGNVGTRLRKLDNGEYDAIILATAGIKRLGMAERIRQYLDIEQILPAIGQGAVGIEARENDTRVLDLIQALNDDETSIKVQAERILSQRLYGGCQLPLAAHAVIDNDDLSLRALVARVDGSETIHAEASGDYSHWQEIAHRVADDMLARGADKILADAINASAV